MKITGILSVSNGTGLQYPFPLVAASLTRLCDDVIVGVDPNFPKDRETLESLESDIQLVDSAWDLTNRNGGTEIAIKMDELVTLAKNQGSDWVVVMQADEVLHDDDFEMLRTFMGRAPAQTTGFSMERIYFWKDLETERKDWSARLVRIFRPGTYSFMAEGTSKDGMYSGPVSPGVEVDLPYKMYHYSRVDSDPLVISKRIRNLDTFFHAEEDLVAVNDLPGYDFSCRPYDNFSVTQPPKTPSGRASAGHFGPHSYTHPIGVREWYNG